MRTFLLIVVCLVGAGTWFALALGRAAAAADRAERMFRGRELPHDDRSPW